MKFSHRMIVSTALLGLAVPMAAEAQVYATSTSKDSGFYIGALVGYASIDLAKSDWDNVVGNAFASVPGGALTSSSVSKGDTAYGLNVGYQVMRNLAVEVGYLDLGKTKGTAQGTVSGVPVNIRGDFKSSGFQGAVIGILPLEYGWSVDGRVGIYAGDTKVQLNASTSAASQGAEESANKTTFLGGVGASYNFYNNYSVRLDYMYIDKVGDTGKLGGTAPVELFSLGVRYLF